MSAARPGDTAPRRARRGLLAVAAAVVTAVLAVPVGPAAADGPAASRTRSAQSVTVRVTDVSPSAPVASTTPRPLVLTATLTNTTGAALTGLTLGAVRAAPIGSQGELDRDLAGKGGTDGLDLRGSAKQTPVDVPAGGTATATFRTTTSTLDDGSGLCLCNDAVYPIVLSARSSTGAVLGTATTYVSSVLGDTDPVRVSWVWPLIDRPHRLQGEADFLDDDLAGSVDGGRLDRALAVVEQLDPAVPITLVVDPELLDELEVMAGGSYTVTSGGRTVAGTGAAAARAWLDRFGTILDTRTAVQISLTPYADPDVRSLSQAGLPWATTLPAAMSRRVTAALRDRAPATDVAWPASGALDTATLSALATSGATTVVLSSSAVTGGSGSGPPPAVARLATTAGPVTGALTSPAMQRFAAAAVAADDGTTDAALPRLVAETAVRTVSGTTDAATGSAVLTPPRYVDPDVARAVRAIEETSTGPLATAVPVRDVVAARPATTSRPRTSAVRQAASLSAELLTVVRELRAKGGAVASLLVRTPQTSSLLTGLGPAAQRLKSSAWLGLPGSPATPADGVRLATGVRDRLQGLLDGVRLVPVSGSYTLGSDTSELPVTVENTLPYAVRVDLEVKALGDLPGYRAEDVDVQSVAADSKQTVQVPSRLQRSGRIRVLATLTTPDGTVLGRPVTLTVRSTVFGAVGLVITVTAGGVLALALLLRGGRGLRRLRRVRDQQRADAVRRAGTFGPGSRPPAAGTTEPADEGSPVHQATP